RPTYRYPPSLHDALPIWPVAGHAHTIAHMHHGYFLHLAHFVWCRDSRRRTSGPERRGETAPDVRSTLDRGNEGATDGIAPCRRRDRKSTRLNSSHLGISY